MQSSVRPRRSSAGSYLVLAAWSACLATGFAMALAQATIPGDGGHAPLVQPARVAGGWIPERFRMQVFVHPQCPCTRVMIEELDRIAARAGSHVLVRVYVRSDPDREATWTKGDYWHAAAAIEGVEVEADPRGEIARACGASTSGTVQLYSPSGTLVFQGGITAARGHAGDNAGADAVVAILLGGVPATCATPVFGCRLFGEADACCASEPGSQAACAGPVPGADRP